MICLIRNGESSPGLISPIPITPPYRRDNQACEVAGSQILHELLRTGNSNAVLHTPPDNDPILSDHCYALPTSRPAVDSYAKVFFPVVAADTATTLDRDNLKEMVTRFAKITGIPVPRFARGDKENERDRDTVANKNGPINMMGAQKRNAPTENTTNGHKRFRG